MQSITHEEQRERWEKEHKTPQVLLQMDASSASSGVVKFIEWLKQNKSSIDKLHGLEVCCGKGRNVIGLAAARITATGLDFSENAIKEARHRARDLGVSDKTTFQVQDVTKPFAVKQGSFDFVVDCFGSTDIESLAGRQALLENVIQALKPGGYLMVYLLSTDDEFHKEMIEKHPGPDFGSFIHPINRKYEKAFTEDEVKKFYGSMKLITLERMPKNARFFGKEYKCNHIWAVFQK